MTKNLILSSNRTFELFSYEGQRGDLLFRSRKSNLYPTRLDILFQDVRASELRFHFSGVNIYECTKADASFLAYSSKPTDMFEVGLRFYLIEGCSWNGYILGGTFASHEDDEEYFSKSALL
jgi:hypothetical protein